MASFQSLRKLDITEDLIIDTTIHGAIGQFQDLRVLSICVRNDCSHLQGCLQALAELNIGGHIQSFLTATSPPHLQSLSLRFVHDPDPRTETLLQCISAIPTAVPTTLSALTLESELAFNPPIASVPDLIHPMLVFRALSDFMLKFRLLPSINDADILTMLTAWPTLTTLRIAHDHTFRHPTSPLAPSRSSPPPPSLSRPRHRRSLTYTYFSPRHC
ncbi:hypothetical protein GSI_04891 [Ganoderma sinense ZZ0214-1]|uniref:F-box domain-containing protein n=1 Tax=Ganoderma sinense ZZ0214-1 TaxID=1077348 RepID=A0A2G8SG73_9APHY|nr:hypothetical protein GSI_04891 [Ganoderma sinense ZZ0214-1]